MNVAHKKDAGYCDVPHLWPITCRGPRWFLSLAHSVESPSRFSSYFGVLLSWGLVLVVRMGGFGTGPTRVSTSKRIPVNHLHIIVKQKSVRQQ